MKSRIVVIDDDADDLEIISQAFSELQLEFECIYFQNSSEAFIALAHDPGLQPDFIFLDYNMGSMRGDELLVKLRSLDKFRHCIMVINSTSLAEEFSVQLLRDGATFTFQKPTNFNDYHTLLSGILQGKYELYQHLEPGRKGK